MQMVLCLREGEMHYLNEVIMSKRDFHIVNRIGNFHHHKVLPLLPGRNSLFTQQYEEFPSIVQVKKFKKLWKYRKFFLLDSSSAFPGEQIRADL